MTKCKICDALKVRVGREPWNEPLIETRNFVVIPSLGALVEGWVLVVPKEHRISMGALPAELRAEVENIERRVRRILRQRYGKPIVAFEHGPSGENHGTGCGVDMHTCTFFPSAAISWRMFGCLYQHRKSGGRVTGKI